MPLSCFAFGGAVFPQRAFRRCPYCGKKIRRQAIKCRFCGQFSDAANPRESVCVACRVMLGVCVLILLGWLVVFIWHSGAG